MKKQELLGLIKELKKAVYDLGVMVATDELATHGNWPGHKQIKKAETELEILEEAIVKRIEELDE